MLTQSSNESRFNVTMILGFFYGLSCSIWKWVLFWRLRQWMKLMCWQLYFEKKAVLSQLLLHVIHKFRNWLILVSFFIFGSIRFWNLFRDLANPPKVVSQRIQMWFSFARFRWTNFYRKWKVIPTKKRTSKCKFCIFWFHVIIWFLVQFCRKNHWSTWSNIKTNWICHRMQDHD